MDTAKEQLRRYIDQINEICSLSSPQIGDVSGADEYRATLIKNFIHIGELARDNQKTLEEAFYPFIQSQDKLDAEELELMRAFAAEFINAYQLTNIDAPLVFYQARRLLQEADASGKDEAIILALDGMVTAAYLMICMTARLMPVDDVCLQYQQEGLRAGERLLTYLEKEKFLTLSPEMKELVVINARYIRVVSEIDGVPQSREELDTILKRMQAAMALAEDPFYREQLPDYNWDLHRFRVYEYVCSLPDSLNKKGYTQEHLAYIHDCSQAMWELYKDPEAPCRAWHFTKNIYLYVIRDAFLAGESSKEQYKRQLEELMARDFRDDPSEDVPVVMLAAPLEYVEVLSKEASLTPAEEQQLLQLYRNLISYLHQTPKKDMLTFLLGVLSLILRHFIELKEMSFEEMGLSLMAAIHPPTYVHTLSVAELTQALTRHLLAEKPELFAGLPGIGSPEEAAAQKEKIEDFAYHAALCHDFGKVLIAETILTYGRNLLEDEFGFIHAHPDLGAYLLSRSASTKAYADVARGHHRWFDDSQGYPDDFKVSESPCRTMIALVACADCLDAATDSVGRSYKRGKSLKQALKEIREGSGTRYAPWLAELLDQEAVLQEIKTILTNGREDNYRNAFHILNEP